MSSGDKEKDKALRKKERAARLQLWMAGRSSRNKSPIDKICRFIVSKAATPKPGDDFLRDPFVDNDEGFDPEELDRFQRGEAG